MKADLHIHSTVSDGSDTILELIRKARGKGLDMIAITEHDTLSHQAQIPAEPGIRVICGVELSAVHKETGTRAHILGYNIQTPGLITALGQPILEARNRNSERQAAILAAHGFAIDLGKLVRADGKYLYKQHVMDWLVATGQVGERFGDFYKTTFKNGGICAFDIDYTDVFDAVKTVKAAGGLAVLAHPGQQQNFWLVPELAAAGLDGLELNHPANSARDRDVIRQLAADHGLFLTGGSDYHGRYEPQPSELGDFLSDESGVAAICQA